MPPSQFSELSVYQLNHPCQVKNLLKYYFYSIILSNIEWVVLN